MTKELKLPTEAELERAAIAYLERYGGSTERVRRALKRRVRRAVAEVGGDPDEAGASIEAVLARLKRLGYLDDERFVASRVRVLRGRGKSARAIRAALASQGLDAAGSLQQEDGEAELEAARAFVRRRRLGPHRAPEDREVERERDLARLARAGFSFEVARRALETRDE